MISLTLPPLSYLRSLVFSLCPGSGQAGLPLFLLLGQAVSQLVLLLGHAAAQLVAQPRLLLGARSPKAIEFSP